MNEIILDFWFSPTESHCCFYLHHMLFVYFLERNRWTNLTFFIKNIVTHNFEQLVNICLETLFSSLCPLSFRFCELNKKLLFVGATSCTDLIRNSRYLLSSTSSQLNLHLNRSVFFNPGSAEPKGSTNYLLGSLKGYK